MNKVIAASAIVCASFVFHDAAAGAYDMTSYRYDYMKQSGSPDKEERKSARTVSESHSLKSEVLVPEERVAKQTPIVNSSKPVRAPFTSDTINGAH